MILVIGSAFTSLVWTPYDPTAIDVASALAGPSRAHALGTDHLGRDVLSMLMTGGRNTLVIAIFGVVGAFMIGIPVGGLAAMRRGWTEEIAMRGADVAYAFPAVILALMFSATLGPSPAIAMVAISFAFMPEVARVTRAASLQIMKRDFVLAAQSYGRGKGFIFLRHVLPNISSAIIVQMTIISALAILAEASLAYLGLGAQPPNPSWGRMLRDAQSFIFDAPLLAVWPGLAIATCVLGFNLVGDGLRDLLDPTLGGRVL